jgi:hypothetical protein
MITPDSIAIAAAVLAERRPATSPWADWVWRAVEVVAEAPAVAPWTVLREEAGRTLFLAGRAEVWLHPTDTDNYRHNLAAESPRVWVVLRPTEAVPGMALHCVTVDAGEAELYGDSGADLLESLPMPAFLREPLEAFVARHHVDRAFHKRRRDRADPEAMARGGRRGDES